MYYVRQVSVVLVTPAAMLACDVTTISPGLLAVLTHVDIVMQYLPI